MNGGIRHETAEYPENPFNSDTSSDDTRHEVSCETDRPQGPVRGDEMPKTLLLADDSIVIQKLVGLSFANEDMEVFTTDNGDDALRRARELRPDLVLADVVMPGKNGYELCEAIKTDASLSHIPVLMLTGTFEAFDEERARRVGSEGHITKPFEAQGLVERVAALLARAPAATHMPAPAPGNPPLGSANPEFATNTGFAREVTAAETTSAHDDDVYDFFDPEPLAAGATQQTAGAVSSTPTSADPDLDLLAGDAGLDTNFDFPADELDDLTMAIPPESQTPLTPQGSVVPPPIPSEAPLTGFEPESHPTMNLAPDPDAVMFGDDPLPEPSRLPAGLADLSETTESRLPADLESVFEFGIDSPAIAHATGDSTLGNELLLDESNSLAEISPGVGDGDTLAFGADTEPNPDRYSVSGSDLGEPFGGDADGRTLTAPEIATSGMSADQAPSPADTATPELSQAMRERIHETLEKIAWEAFADVSDAVVRQVVARVESIAWEVVPQMAEALIEEELRRMKGDE